MKFWADCGKVTRSWLVNRLFLGCSLVLCTNWKSVGKRNSNLRVCVFVGMSFTVSRFEVFRDEYINFYRSVFYHIRVKYKSTIICFLRSALLFYAVLRIGWRCGIKSKMQNKAFVCVAYNMFGTSPCIWNDTCGRFSRRTGGHATVSSIHACLIVKCNRSLFHFMYHSFCCGAKAFKVTLILYAGILVCPIAKKNKKVQTACRSSQL